MMNQSDATLEKFELVRRESAGLFHISKNIQDAVLSLGYITDLIRIGFRGCLEVDLYNWRLQLSSLNGDPDWDVDKWEAEMLRLPFKGKEEFKRAYRLARLVTRIRA
ncbi:hypothetical protein AB7293_16770 [Providencia huaxiensis]|uniref:hypothetical protein n=1 Tax=Providencia huaxiensis TaxID=2027290 RepID=UPI0034E5FDF2